MAKLQSKRKNCRDVFNAFLVALAYYAGIFEFPIIQPVYDKPNRLIVFSKAISSHDYDQWVHFYEDDYEFERIWRNPRRYLFILKRYNGVILPDFSVYRDMPFVMQLWNIYRSRAIGFWLQQNGIKVIVNVRYGDWRTYYCCCDGVPTGCVIAVGSNGILDDKDDRKFFATGLRIVVRRLKPTTIVVYGGTPSEIFDVYRKAGIEVLSFETDFTTSRKKVN